MVLVVMVLVMIFVNVARLTSPTSCAGVVELEPPPVLPRLEFSLLSLPGLVVSSSPSLTTDRSDLLRVRPPCPPWPSAPGVVASSVPGVVALLPG